MAQPILIKKLNKILSSQNTQNFIKYLDLALMDVDIQKLKEVFEQFELTTHPDTQHFLSTGKYLFKKYRSAQENVELIKVENRYTKCIACSFGKTVKAYDVIYKKVDSDFSAVYLSSYAINLNITKSGELLEFAWCNAFLSKEEMNEFIRI